MKFYKLFSRPRYWLLVVVVLVLLAEASARAFGLVNFPVYEANAQIGYIPAADQRGSFLNKNDWQFNALHMGAPEFEPHSERDVLLVGDSLVYGGNAYRQAERLGPSLQGNLQARGGAAVWPISAGSWTLRNELAYMRLNPQVPGSVKSIVFLLNSGDFGAEASSWRCELTHPLIRPTVALWYLFNKYIYALQQCGDVPAALKVADGDLAAELQEFLSMHGHKTTFVLYPDKSELSDPALEAKNFEAGESLLRSTDTAKIVYVSKDRRWNDRYYKDGIHPTAEGNRVLAGVISDALVWP